jgi:hypothetical protein
MLSDKSIQIFNNLTQMVLSDILQSETTTLKNVTLVRCRNDYSYNHYDDLIFQLTTDYNNRRILYESILSTCDDLFTWMDISRNVRIVIISGKVNYFTYFELFDVVFTDYINDYYNYTKKTSHPKYKEYREWKKNKIAEEAVRKEYERVILEQQRRVEEQIRITTPKKKKFLFW